MAIGNWQQLTNSGIESEATIVSSQSVIGEKYLEAKLQRTVGNGRRIRSHERRRVSSQSVIGEINLCLLSFISRIGAAALPAIRGQVNRIMALGPRKRIRGLEPALRT